MTQTFKQRPGRLSPADLIEQHKLTREFIASEGYEPVEVPHPFPRYPGETVWIAGEFIGDSGAFDGGCFTCGDLGCVTHDVPVDHPHFGKLFPCPAHCAAERKLKADHDARLYAATKLPDEHRGCTLATFEACISAYPAGWPGKELAYYAVKRYLDTLTLPEDGGRFDLDFADVARDLKRTALNDVRRSLILSGDYGLGKTGLAAAICNAGTALGLSVRYTRTMALLDAIQNRYNADWREHPLDDDFGDLEAGNIVDLVERVPLLILDDFDLPNLRDDSDKASKMQAIIRYRHGWHLPTIITTNLRSMKEIEVRWGATTATVLGQMAHFIPMSGEALRPTPQMLEAAR